MSFACISTTVSRKRACRADDHHMPVRRAGAVATVARMTGTFEEREQQD
jgi:hypothetical protein